MSRPTNKTIERVVAFCFMAVLNAPATLGGAKISEDLVSARSTNGEVVNVIVQFRTPVTQAHHQKVTARGGQLKQALELVQGGLYSMPAAMVEDLAQDPEVSYVSPDRTVHGMLDYADSFC